MQSGLDPWMIQEFTNLGKCSFIDEMIHKLNVTQNCLFEFIIDFQLIKRSEREFFFSEEFIQRSPEMSQMTFFHVALIDQNNGTDDATTNEVIDKHTLWYRLTDIGS